MKIAIIGVGAVGGYFGGRLAQAGHDVTFVARNKTLEALRSQGLRVNSVAGDFAIARPQVASDPKEIGQVDVVLIGVKAWQVADVAPTLKPLVGPETVVLPLQNGLEAPGILADVLGANHVLVGLCKIFAMSSAPAAIEHLGLQPSIEFGEFGNKKTERIERIRAAFEAAEGMSAVTPDDIEAAMWLKLLFVEPLGAVGAVAREPVGVIRTVPETRSMLEAAIGEVVSVGLKRGVALSADLPAKVMRRIGELPPDGTTSMHRDIIAGQPSEFEFQTGVVVRYARESNVPVPVQSSIYAALLPSELRARGELPSPQ